MLPSSSQPARRGRSPILLAIVAGIALAAAACGSSTATSVAGPTPPRCQVTLSGSPSGLPPSGGSGTITVTTDRDCTWTAASGAAWIALSGPTSGQGNGSFPFSVAANGNVAARTGGITVNGQTFTISQQPAPCTFAVSPSAVTAPQAGGAAAVSVQAQSGCPWTSASNAAWISITSGANGNGNGTVQLVFAANTADARTGTVTVAGQIVTVTQAAAPPPPPPPPGPQPFCVFAIAPTGRSIDAAGGTGSVSVITTSACSWTAASPVPWLTITSGSAGTGSGSVTFAVAANTGPARSASLSIAGLAFVVSQAGDPAAPPPPPAPCSFSISPTSQSFNSDGGNGSVSVKTTSSCSWTASSSALWVTITAGSSGTGNGSVSYTVAPNTDVARSATLPIAGQPFTVNQAAMTCSYSVSPQNTSVSATGGAAALTITVSTTGSCAWTATSNVSWMTITSGASGTGSGSVVVSVDPNTGGPRNGTLTVAGQSVNVHQDPANTVNVSGPVVDLSGICPTLRFELAAYVVFTNGSTAFARGPCKDVQNDTNVGVQGYAQPDSSVLATQVTLLKQL